MKAQKPKAKTETKEKNTDIVQLILEDHKPLKKLIKTLKNTEADEDERREAFQTFADLLISHSRPEEDVLYAEMKEDEDMREEGCEGEVEHGLADQMVEEAKRARDHDIWSAKVKVLAELVEHHIEEEEDELLPKYKKQSSVDERRDLGEEFLKAKRNIGRNGMEKNPTQKPEIHAPH